MSEYPKMMYGAGALTRTVHDDADEAEARVMGYGASPADRHREPAKVAVIADIGGAAALTEAHVPLIVEQVTEAVFARLKGMAVAAAGEPAHHEAAVAVAALDGHLDDRFAALRADILDGIGSLIAPAAPAAAPPHTGKAR